MPVQYRSDALNRALHTLHRTAPEVIGSAIITHDGLIIAAHPPGWDSNVQDVAGGEHVSAMAAVITANAEKAMVRLGQGPVERVLIESERGIVTVWPATQDSALVLLVGKNAKLGLTMHAARQAVYDISQVLAKSNAP